MKITDLINKNAIELKGTPQNKQQAIEQMVDLMMANNNLSNKERYKQIVFERENESTTGIGEGIAIPHGKSNSVFKPGLSAMVIPEGVKFESLDGKKVNLIFLIAAPNSKENVHLDVLSKLSTLLMNEKFRVDLQNVQSKEEFLKVIDEAEKKQNQNKENGNKKEYEILAITACPTGIAHTYMAAESLEKAGMEIGLKVKVETHGQAGVKNKFTQEEIKKAKGIIIAADTQIDLSRFDGKKILITKVSNGIHKPKELLEEVLLEETQIYHSELKEKSDIQRNDEKFGRQIYKHLMNGVTHMLPFVVGGGILIAIAFLLDDYSIDPTNFGMNTPIAAFFKTIGGYAFDVMLYILAGYIAMSIADRPGLAVGFVGGILAVNGTTFQSLSDSNLVLVSSGFLGALIAGFIGGYLTVVLKRVFSKLPNSLEGMKPVLLYPLFGILLIGVVMLLINPYIASINERLNNFLAALTGVNKVLLGMMLGGMMSVDLGGPVNKAAYTFGTGMLASGQYEIMAAVMAGGMVAPLAIAILATIFPKKIPQKERQSALLNYILGASFITEGAIPFASSDPIKVLVSCILGSAIAGGLSMAFSCTLMAPHGGLFVIAVVGHPIKYLISIIIGAFVSTLIMGIWKKNIINDERR